MRLRYAPSTGRRLPPSMTDVSNHPRDVLRHAAFRGFWIAVLASRLAMQILTVAVGWYIYDLTGSALALNSTGSQAVIISGPALGGALYLLGPPVVFTAVTALFALACFLGVQLARRRDVDTAPISSGATGFAALFAGLQFIRSRQEI